MVRREKGASLEKEVLALWNSNLHRLRLDVTICQALR